ncbi:MAG: GntR family transcriptional regulator [Chloroflexi bacterium]|nr:GntR family transcriptional regulator [Chloroflexota bacterium]
MRKPKTFLYLEIAESLRRRIASGELQPGEKLSPVREMARRWSCTPGTVSRTYTQLAEEGLVVGHRGGGTRVTSSALQPERPTWQWATLINRAEQFLLEAINKGHTPVEVESALSVAISRWQELQRGREGQPRSESAGATVELVFAGSHDLAVDLMTRMLAEEAPDVRLSVEYVGSLGGLMALANDKASVAGSHLWDETTDTYNVPFVQRLLPGRRVVLLTLAHRSLGLAVPPGNPQKIKSLVDITKPGVRLINRQSGSGTRVWLDAQLKSLDVQLESVSGYEQEEITHLAVAHAVEDGRATVGLGIHAAAAACGLDFVPLTKERYDLVLSEAAWSLPTGQALVKVVRSDRFQETISALGGYDTAETGQETWVS